ncbi:MAG TPA: phytanoyl-CoA dioxygenase family protein [Gemmataceae bacterium]|nr:phytanoyl-CoA dioxygenase family protein [Gemmataceae bacterium]
MTLSALEMRHLDEDGYLILERFLDAGLLARLRACIEELFREEGERAGHEFKLEPGCRRLANLVNKDEVFREVILLPRLLEYVRHVLGRHIKLSSLHARSADPHGIRGQPLHADMSAIADEHGPWVCNTLWMLDDFTAENGALRVVPGSHRFRRLPADSLADPLADHPDQVLLTGPAGSVVVLNAHAWHAGTANRADRPRTAMHAFYCRRDKPQQQYQKRLLSSQVQESLSPALRDLLALDDPLNDQLSSEAGVRSGVLK